MKKAFLALSLLCSINTPCFGAQVVQPKVLGPAEQKFVAGDWVVLDVEQPRECKECVPQMHMELEKGPMKFGNGRMLSWKKTENNHLQVVLTSYTPGGFEIPSIIFVEKTGNPTESVFETEPLVVQFEKVEGDKKQDELYGPVQMSLPKWIAQSALLFTVLLAALIFYMLKRRKKFVQIASVAPKLNPIEEFESARKSLNETALIESQNYKKLYFGLSEAAKRFLGKAYSIEAEDKTTRELIELMSEYRAVSIFTSQMIEQWKNIFEEMDIVKFTDHRPQADHAKETAVRLATLVAAAWKLSPAYKETAQPKSKYIKP